MAATACQGRHETPGTHLGRPRRIHETPETHLGQATRPLNNAALPPVTYTPQGYATVPPVPVGYKTDKDALPKRLARIEGQVRGVSKMVEEERYCIDVLTQIGAVEAALDKVALGLIDDHARHCVLDAEDGERAEKVDELVAALGRFVGH